MRNDLSSVWLIMRRELKDQFRDWRVMVPLAIFSLLFPFLVLQMAGIALNFVEQYGARLIAERFVPFFMLVAGFLPVTVSMVVSLEAFVGEKERGTIEPLLSSPLADWQMYIGKLLAGLAFPLLSSYSAIGIYLLNLPRLQIPWPEANIMAQTLVLTGVHAVVMVAGAIIVSTQSTSVRAANLLASFIIIPVALLVQGEVILMFWGKDNQVLWWAVAGVLILAGLLVRAGVAHFQRESLLGRDLDTLNLRWIAQVFWRAFSAGARTSAEWFARALRPALRNLRMPFAITVVIGLTGYILAFDATLRFLSGLMEQLSPAQLAQLLGEFTNLRNVVDPASRINFGWLFWHNLQALLVSFLMGLVSFGILSMLTLLANLGLLGSVLALAQMGGYSPGLLFLVGILPHGIFELPALFLANAAALRLGAVLVTPDTSRSLGEVFLEALADWAKIMTGLVIPLLALAALVEAYFTPLLLMLTVGG